MEDRFDALPEAFNQMMLLPNMPNFRTSHSNLTKVHQIITAGGAFPKKEENQRSKGWAVPLDSTRGYVNPPCRIMQNQCFFPCLPPYIFFLLNGDMELHRNSHLFI